MATQNEVKDDPAYIACLDHGFVGLVDSMGDDDSIVQAARVSYGKGTKKVNEDRHLIRYLLRHYHTTPFEMVEFKFHMKLPLFAARQLIRHRTANVNEYSGRYSEMPNEFYIPELSALAPQSKSNHQGRDGEMDGTLARAAQAYIDDHSGGAYACYQALLGNDETYRFPIDGGIAKELARMVLPLNNYTEWYWKCDAKNIFHFLNLRDDPHAQWEIRVFAEAMASLIQPIIPVAFEAFEDYWHQAATVSRMELDFLKVLVGRALLDSNEKDFDSWAEVFGIKGRELLEFKSKIGVE